MAFLDARSLPEASCYCLRQARVPTSLIGPPVAGAQLDADGAALLDMVVDGDRIAALAPAGTGLAPDLGSADMAGRHVWPALVDMHAHIDKGHAIPRINNPD